MSAAADPRATALFLGAFFDELARWGVHDVVVSPGSRSTPLAMCAYELSRRHPERLRLFVDVDERGAAFFAVGLAKADGHPAAVICTSGTAVANYYPAVLEAESSRVPLIVLTGDRPPRLQGLGAPQTCDQLNAYGSHVRAFRQMPLPSADAPTLALARQAAREAAIAAGAGCAGGPVHLNFPFEEPLKPDFGAEDPFAAGRRPDVSRETSKLLPGVAPVARGIAPAEAERLAALLARCRALVLAGEGTCGADDDARAVLDWAHAFDLPLLADPLSGLRRFDDACIIDRYGTVLGPGGTVREELRPEVIVRFGRYPVSKRAVQFAASCGAAQVVVDPLETRDFNAATDAFVPCEPAEFARMLRAAALRSGASGPRAGIGEAPGSFAAAWARANDAARAHAQAVDDAPGAEGFEGAFARRALALAPEGSCLFAANSMSIRTLDAFYLRSPKRLTVLCNRGLNGIDGTVSSALGAAQRFAQTTLLTGDLTLLHDLNALALQRELRVQREAGGPAPSIIIVLINNNGGGIFDMLPQRSDDAYFERLFLTPQDVDFEAAARAFSVPYRCARTVDAFDVAYRELLGTPGISLIETPVPLDGLRERYAPYGGLG